MIKNGFTLIEILITLSVVGVLLMLTVPLQFSSLTKLGEEQFIKQLEHDVLLVQNQSSYLGTKKMSIRFNRDHYQIFHGITYFAKRDYPTGWSIGSTMQITLRFKETGTLLDPRTVIMNTPTEEIRIIFPLGKGRFYIEKNKRLLHD